MADIQKRKKQHIELAKHEGSQMGGEPFGRYMLPYVALPEIALEEVDTGTTLLGKTLHQPLIIASMTGGAAHALTINKHLAIAAEETHVALGVGSQRVALEVPKARESFAIVRRCAPTAVVFANMAAVQLNYGYTVEHYRRVVDMVEADALYLHINPLQEAIQPEGDTNFAHLLDKIHALVEAIDVPVFAKEVGHGLDPQSAKKLIEIGVAGIDVAGSGGTSWSWIEAQRAQDDGLGNWFKSFGLPTEYVLTQIAPHKKHAHIVASGGIRNPVQGLKARALGADLYSAAHPFLMPALDSERAVIEMIQKWQRGLQIAMFACGVANWQQAAQLTLVRND